MMTQFLMQAYAHYIKNMKTADLLPFPGFETLANVDESSALADLRQNLVTTAAIPPHSPLGPGQINLDLIPSDFPLTPLKGKKAYLPNWTKDPKTVSEIRRELEEGHATGVGLLCGQWSNELAIIMVDIDGKEAIPAIEELGGGPLRDRKSTRLNSSHEWISRMPSSA